jgi:alpha-mannosidase
MTARRVGMQGRLGVHRRRWALIRRREFLRGMLALVGGGLYSAARWRLALPVAAQVLPKRIYLAPDDHTDYFWSASDSAYQQAFLEMLDYYLDRADATAADPPDWQSRWHCDGSFWIWTYERNRTPAQFERLMARVRDGHISFPLNPLVVCSGGMPAEALLRGMYYAGRLERRYGLRIPLAEEIENQTLPYGLGALWAGAGARYSWKGICGCDTQVPSPGDRQHELYWWVGPDGSRILMKWNSMLATNQGIGGYAEAWSPSSIIDYVDSDPTFLARYPFRVVGTFGQGWDNTQTMNQDCVAAAKAKSTAERRVIVSNMVDFFRDLEETYGPELPAQACTFGNEWELYAAALSGVSSRVRRAVERLRGAEALAACACLADPTFEATIDSAARERAWMDLGLYPEHNLGMVNRSGDVVAKRITWQRDLATEVETYVDGLQTAAKSGLGGLIRRSGSAPRFYAFNPLSWARTDVADLPYADEGPVQVIDLGSGQRLPSQRVTVGDRTFLRVLAKNVPAMGYRVYEVQPGAGATAPDAAAVAGGRIENARYRLTLANRGAITSLVDKTLAGREFVREVGGRFANDLGSGTGLLEVENAGPVSVTLRATAVGPVAHTTRVTLFAEIGRVAIENEITQGFQDVLTWAFGLAVSAPTTWHEEVGAIICARLLADGGHYSPRNARYDWLTLNHLADMSGGGYGVTLSNADCAFMRLGNSTVTSLDTRTPQINVLAGGRVANGANGLPNQGGDTYFLQRFALQTHTGFDAAQAMRFALEHQNPLLTGAVTGGAAYPAAVHAFLSLSNPNVLLWALKPAEDGIAQGGVIARVWNLSAEAASFTLSLSQPLVAMQNVTHIETPTGDKTPLTGTLADTLAPQQIKSYALYCEAATGTPRATPAPPRRLHIPIV